MCEGGDELEDRKLFVGGLSWGTTEDSLRNYFCQFGELQEVTVKTDRVTNKPRGFGFVKFKDQQSIQRVFDEKTEHNLDGKKIDPKPATKSDKSEKAKVFVGGIPPLREGETIEALSQQLQSLLEKHGGKVTAVDIKEDTNTGRHKGFGFVTFENPKGAEEVCKTKFFEFNGKNIDCKKADPRQSRQGGGGYPASGYFYPQHQHHHWESGGGYAGSQAPAGSYAYSGGSGTSSDYSYVPYPSQSYPHHHHHQAPHTQDTSGGQMTTGYENYGYSHGSSRGDATGYGGNYPSYSYSGQGGHTVGYNTQHQQQQSSYYGHHTAQPHHN